MWKQSVALAIARSNKFFSKGSDNIIHTLLETQNPESILLAGYYLAETGDVNPELSRKIRNALSKLSSDTNIAGRLREQTLEVLKRIGGSN